MLPHERSLVTRLEGRPFVLLGVNCDREKETLQRVTYRDQLSWRNWWDGGSELAMTAKYGVTYWPQTVLIDGQGVIRGRNLFGADLDRAVEELVRETENRNAR